MWFDNRKLNTIAHPLDQLPSTTEKQSLTGSLSVAEVVRHQEASELLIDELRSAPAIFLKALGTSTSRSKMTPFEAVDWAEVINKES